MTQHVFGARCLSKIITKQASIMHIWIYCEEFRGTTIHTHHMYCCVNRMQFESVIFLVLSPDKVTIFMRDLEFQSANF